MAACVEQNTQSARRFQHLELTHCWMRTFSSLEESASSSFVSINRSCSVDIASPSPSASPLSPAALGRLRSSTVMSFKLSSRHACFSSRYSNRSARASKRSCKSPGKGEGGGQCGAEKKEKQMYQNGGVDRFYVLPHHLRGPSPPEHPRTHTDRLAPPGIASEFLRLSISCITAQLVLGVPVAQRPRARRCWGASSACYWRDQDNAKLCCFLSPIASGRVPALPSPSPWTIREGTSSGRFAS